MIQILLISHGEMAEGVKNSLEMLIGKQEQVSSLAFTEELDKENFKDQLRDKVTSFGDEPVLIIGDLVGGTPCNCALELFIDNENIDILAPMSLPLVLSASMGEDKSINKDALLASSIETHKDLKKMMNELLKEVE